MHKVALDLGFRQIHWYGICVAVAFVVGLAWAARRGRRDGLPGDAFYDLAPWLILGTIVGARTLFVVNYWDQYFAGEPWTEVLMVHKGGLVFYGGLIGASLTAILWFRWKNLPLWRMADALAPSIALGHAIGRIGCLMNGCCYGRGCDLPWAITFPPGHETHPNPVHPTQIYETLLNGALALYLAHRFGRRRFPGEVFAIYLIGYAGIRSIVELYRGDYPYRHFGFLSPGQLVSIVIAATGITLYRVLAARARTAEASSTSDG